MMKTNFFILIILTIVMSFSCKKKESLLPVTYSAWGTTTKRELNYPISGHENQYRKIFINEIGTKVQRTEKDGKYYYEYPVNTIIIKEIYPTLDYKQDDKPIMLTAMVKDPSHPKALGGWLWIVKDLKQNKEIIKTETFCFTCHTNANETHQYIETKNGIGFGDYIFFPYNEE